MSELKVHASKCDIEPMVQSDDLRQAFSVRLKKALSLANIPERGAGARLAKISGKTAKAASKWLNAETMPGRSSMADIAKALGVRAEWLQYGVEPISGSDITPNESQVSQGFNLSALGRIKGKATPRSLAVIARIEKAAMQGRLKEADLVLLEGIAARFEELNSSKP
jgi:transcriptional regulator with XRE-family HTH domain